MAKNDNDFSDQLSNVFNSPFFGIGVGLLAGALDDDISLADGLGYGLALSKGAMKREAQQIELEKKRRKLDAFRRQRQAQKELIRRMTASRTVPVIPDFDAVVGRILSRGVDRQPGLLGTQSRSLPHLNALQSTLDRRVDSILR